MRTPKKTPDPDRLRRGRPKFEAIHPSSLAIEQLVQQCTLQRTRRSGPGGQHRNKVETAVVVTHEPSGIKAAASERRSQKENRDVALRRLRINLALNVRINRPSEAVPSELWKSRCASRRLMVATAHDDFPPLLAEALDVIANREYEVRVAAQDLGVTTSQLIKFVQQEPRAFQLLNQQRSESGLAPLK